MKRGGLAVFAVLLVSGLLRFTSPSPQAPGKTETDQNVAAKRAAKSTYTDELSDAIAASYGPPEGSAQGSYDSAAHWNVPQNAQASVRFAIALVPDPVHTHLGLFFDRSMEALIQAAQKKHYIFDRSTLPWERSRPPESSDPTVRQAQEAERAAREAYPGLLIFRVQPKAPLLSGEFSRTDSSSDASGAVAKPDAPQRLLVFLVGETPTGGLSREQFRHAREMMKAIAGPEASATAKKPMLILGPTFSGSLDSLQSELQYAEFASTYVYSGTVTGVTSRTPLNDAHFASFQQNDEYALAEFARFANFRGYPASRIAVLSEDGTAYGAQRGLTKWPGFEERANDPLPKQQDERSLQLHFPREISYLRSAYQKQGSSDSASVSSSAPSNLPSDLSEAGNDDDSVPPYGGAQVPRTQEAVMLGIVSELQKHHIEFTVVLATDPVDELFLTHYLRHAYPQGRVVVTSPDLLFFREEDAALTGVLGLNSYSLVPGLNDRLCGQHDSALIHEDRLFVSSSSVGTFNAFVGLLSIDEAISRDAGQRQPEDERSAREWTLDSRFLPPAPYAEYGTPLIREPSGEVGCDKRPLLWITILGRDGFWPIVGIPQREVRSADHQEPIANFPMDREGPPGTLSFAAGQVAVPPPESASMPTAWSLAYCLCLMLLIAHVLLSLNGTILADSEVRAQFARHCGDRRATSVLALGALALGSIFCVLMGARTFVVTWTGGTALTLLLWLPFPIFVGLSLWDIGKLRKQPGVARAFASLLAIFFGFQLYLAGYPEEHLRTYWSNRLVHLTSGVSPILPVLLLLAAGYWWMWMSLRGISLVDLRRPRLPERGDLCNFSYRISDTEADELRETAHPFFFIWPVLLPVLLLALLALTVVDLRHPVQTIEGWAYDIGFSLLLALMIATLLGVLLKLVNTWLKCRQILSGLDRTPLRCAFSRMKHLSWHSFWNPGGSTLRETFKIMSRGLEGLERLEVALPNEKNCPLDASARQEVLTQIGKTKEARRTTVEAYMKMFPENNGELQQTSSSAAPPPTSALPADMKEEGLISRLDSRWKRRCRNAEQLGVLTKNFEELQRSMAKTAAVLICKMLIPWWGHEPEPAVSEDPRLKLQDLCVSRALAEEFTGLVYVNFLVTVLLRMRTQVICASGLYVLLVLAIGVYPFEPHPALQSLTVILLLALGAAVGFVYAEMHREAILSRLTSTNIGELGLDFWVKLASAGAIPLFSLLAAQFPSINQYLFSWLEPALQAMK